MRKISLIASFLFFSAIGIFISTNQASAASTSNITGSGASGSTISSITVNSSLGGHPATFSVSVSCSNCVDDGGWECAHSSASDDVSSMSIDRAEVTLANSSTDYDYYTVTIYPTDYSFSTNYCGFDNTAIGLEKGYCYVGHQSIKGTVKVPKGSTVVDDSDDTCVPNPVTTSSSSTTQSTEYFTLNTQYLRYGTGATITCETPLSQGPFSVTTYTTTTTYTTDDGCGNSSSYDVVSVSTTPPEQAYINPPSFICGDEYRYHHADPGTGPISMNENKTVDLYYEQVHHLTVTPRRHLNDANMCQGEWQSVYYDSDTNTSASITAPSPIAVGGGCLSGDYEFYYFGDSPYTQYNVSSSGNIVYPSSTLEDSWTRAFYRRRNTLTLKHLDFYHRDWDTVANDQFATALDYDSATINNVTNPAHHTDRYGTFDYQLVGYAANRNDIIVPNRNTRTSYTESYMTRDVTRWAIYKKKLKLIMKPVDRSGRSLAADKVKEVLEGEKVSVTADTIIGNYTFTGFADDQSKISNPDFPKSYVYSIDGKEGIRDKDKIVYAVYETVDDIKIGGNINCLPRSGENAQTQSYVKNMRYDNTDPYVWNSNITYAKPGDQVSFCTGYYNKYPYWNFMFPEYNYLEYYGANANLDHSRPLGYSGNIPNLKKQLYSVFSGKSNRKDGTRSIQFTNYGAGQLNNGQLNFNQDRANQQKNFFSSKRSQIKNYPANASDASIAFNKPDVGSSVTMQGQINVVANNTSTRYLRGNGVINVITSLPIDRIEDATGAKAVFPYNFQNSTSINKGSNNYVDSGGTTTLSINLTVNPKKNQATRTDIGGEYATVDEGDIYYRVEVTTSDSSVARTVTDPIRYRTRGTSTNKINAENKVGGDSVTIASRTLYVPDVDPGVDVCFRTSMWPRNSDKDGSGTSTDANGGYTSTADESSWSDWSQPVCYRAKSVPTLQAWGGNVIANGQIATSFKRKFHIYPNNYLPLGPYNESHIFGSWGELGVIANRNTQFMASGTALGYPNGLVRSASMSENDTYERFVPLTFANYDPNLPTTTKLTFGGLNKTYSSEDQTFDKSMLVNKYIYNTGVNYNNSTLTLNGDITASYMGTDYYHADNNVYYYHANPNLQINSSEIAKNATQVIHVNGDIRISGNITYLNTYTRLENIPKLIIYADGGAIKIDYNVSQVDAILIADTVVTCSEESGCKIPAEGEVVTNPANSYTPLKINGTIIAKRVIPNRSYGAGKGVGQYGVGPANSITPAEVINYDPSLYRWEQYSANQSESKISPDASLVTTYLKEVAPRY